MRTDIIPIFLYVLLGEPPYICDGYTLLTSADCLYCLVYLKILPLIFFFGVVAFFIQLVLYEEKGEEESQTVKKLRKISALISIAVSLAIVRTDAVYTFIVLFSNNLIVWYIFITLIALAGSVLFFRTQSGILILVPIIAGIYMLITLFGEIQNYLSYMPAGVSKCIPPKGAPTLPGGPTVTPQTGLPPQPPVSLDECEWYRDECDCGNNFFNLKCITKNIVRECCENYDICCP